MENCISLHFQSFMIVGWWVQGVGRCTLQGGRGGLFSTKEQQAAGKQAGEEEPISDIVSYQQAIPACCPVLQC